jgi:cytoskeletal protein RodZ
MTVGVEGLGGAGGVVQAASVPTISAVKTRRRSVDVMGLILLEALLALVLLVAIVWWTMFSGRKRGELEPSKEHPDRTPPP